MDVTQLAKCRHRQQTTYVVCSQAGSLRYESLDNLRVASERPVFYFLPVPFEVLPEPSTVLAKEIKNGTVVNYDDAPVLIESITVQTPSARGAATLYKYKGRNLVTRQKVDITLKGTESLDVADFERREVKLMYTDATHAHLLDQADYNQFSILLQDVEDEMPYVTESLEGMQALIYNSECVGLQLPTTIELTVTQCDPGVKGDSATKRSKPATLETGLVVQVPEYLSQGERIKVDSRTGAFISRA